MSNTMSESILEAINTLSNQSLRDAASTIECTVTEVKPNNEYVVATQGGAKFSAIPTYDKAEYKVDDKVYVMIPGGDFNKTKVIIGYSDAVQKARNLKRNAFAKSRRYYNISSNLSHLTNEFLSLNSYVEKHIKLPVELEDNAVTDIYTTQKVDDVVKKENIKQMADIITKSFQEANASQPVYLEVKVEIKTDIYKPRERHGDYGIVISVPYIFRETKDVTREETREYYLTTNAAENGLKGTPTEYLDWSTQVYNISFPEGAICVDPKKRIEIEFYNTEFTPLDEKPEEYDPNTYKDIFFRNLSMYMVKEYPYSAQGAFLYLTATEGEWFTPSLSNKKTITANLMIDGVETDLNDVDIFWGEECCGQSSGDESVIGKGYRILNQEVTETTENSKKEKNNKIYVKNLSQLDVDGKYVPMSKKYKCIVRIEEQQRQFEAEITLKRLLSNAKIKLEFANSTTGRYQTDNDMNVEINAYLHVDNETNYESDYDKFVPSFECINKNGAGVALSDSYVQIIYPDPGERMISIDEQRYFKYGLKFPASCIDEAVLIKFTAQKQETDSSGNKYLTVIGSDQIIAYEGDGIGRYTLVIENSNTVYHYDANGDSPYSTGFSNSYLKGNIEPIKPFIIRIYDNDNAGNEIEDYTQAKVTWRVPAASMFVIDDYEKDPNWKKLDNGDLEYKADLLQEHQLIYSILPKFDYTNSNEHTQFTIEYGGEVLLESDDIIFTKDGMNGTNGSEFTAAIKVKMGNDDYAFGEKDEYGKERKLILFYNATDTQSEDDKLYAYQFNESGGPGGLAKLSTLSYKLIPRVFCNGIELTKDEFDIIPEIVGLSTKGDVTCPIVKIKDEGSKEYKIVFDSSKKDNLPVINDIASYIEKDNATGKLLDWYNEHPNSDMKNYASVNIVKFTISPKKGSSPIERGDSQQFNKKLYVYYPIELVVTMIPGDDPYGQEGFKSADLPYMAGGFFEVLYNNSGQKPNYDQSPFEISGVPSNVKGIKWKGSDYIDVEFLPDEEEEGKFRQDKVKIAPPQIYNNAVLKNYIKAIMNFGTDEMKKHYDDEKKSIEESIAELTTNRDIYADIAAIFNEFYGGDGGEGNNWKNFEAIQDFYANEYMVYISQKGISAQQLRTIIEEAIGVRGVIDEAMASLIVTGLTEEEIEISEEDEKVKEQNAEATIEYKDDETTILGEPVKVMQPLIFNAYKDAATAYDNYITFVKDAYDRLLHQADFCLNPLPMPELSDIVYQTIYDRDPLIVVRMQVLKNDVDHFNSADELEKRQIAQQSYQDNCDRVEELYAKWCQPLQSFIDKYGDIEDTTIKNWLAYARLIMRISYEMPEAARNALSGSTIANINRQTLVPALERYANIDKDSKYYYPIKVIEPGEEKGTYTFVKEILRYVKSFNKTIEKHENRLSAIDTMLFMCSSNVFYIRPVILSTFLEGLEFLNGWDGVSVDIGDNYIACPTFGAGIKDEDNKFSGVVGGLLNPDSNKTEDGIIDPIAPKLGLFGIDRNETSFFLNARNGSAIFGKSGSGQIIIDPSAGNRSYIYSGNYFTNLGRNTDKTDPGAKGTVLTANAYDAVDTLNNDNDEDESSYNVIDSFEINAITNKYAERLPRGQQDVDDFFILMAFKHGNRRLDAQGNPVYGEIEGVTWANNKKEYLREIKEKYQSGENLLDQKTSTLNGRGLLIDLSKGAIRFGSGNFSVSPHGYLYARGGGSIAGWNIKEDSLESPIFDKHSIRLRPGYSKDDPAALICVKYNDNGTEEHVAAFSQNGFKFGDNFSLSVNGTPVMNLTRGGVIKSNWVLDNEEFPTGVEWKNNSYPSYVINNDIGIAIGQNILKRPRTQIDPTGTFTSLHPNPFAYIDDDAAFRIHYYENAESEETPNEYEHFTFNIAPGSIEAHYGRYKTGEKDPLPIDDKYKVDSHWLCLNGAVMSLSPKYTTFIGLHAELAGFSLNDDNKTYSLGSENSLVRKLFNENVQLYVHGNSFMHKHLISNMSVYSKVIPSAEVDPDPSRMTTEVAKKILSYIKNKSNIQSFKDEDNKHYVIGPTQTETTTFEDVIGQAFDYGIGTGENKRAFVMANLENPNDKSTSYVSIESLLYLIIAALDLPEVTI